MVGTEQVGRRLFRVAVGGIGLLVGACTGTVQPSSETDELAGSVQNSLETWSRLKADGGSSYRYTRGHQSWTGSGFRLTVDVIEDVPVRRSYEAFTNDPNGATSQVTDTWEETGSELGAHALTGFEALPIEGLYERCLDEVLTRQSSGNDFAVSFHDDGLLEACFSWPKSCADDCAQGVGIDTFRFTK